jgi:hypothetical protein
VLIKKHHCTKFQPIFLYIRKIRLRSRRDQGCCTTTDRALAPPPHVPIFIYFCHCSPLPLYWSFRSTVCLSLSRFFFISLSPLFFPNFRFLSLFLPFLSSSLSLIFSLPSSDYYLYLLPAIYWSVSWIRTQFVHNFPCTRPCAVCWSSKLLTF